jgi:hypothetical protein
MARRERRVGTATAKMIYSSLQLVEEHFVAPVVPSAVPPTRPFIPRVTHAILPSAGFLIAACLLCMDVPANAASTQTVQAHRHAKTSHRANAAPAEHVTYSDGQLSVQSNGADLAVVLGAIQQATGVKISGMAAAQKQKLVGDFGPGDPASVLAAVLDGTRLNYIFLKSQTNPSVVRSVMLYAQSAPQAQPLPAPPPAPSSATQRTSPPPVPQNPPQSQPRNSQTGEGSPAAEPAPAEPAPAEPAPRAQQPPENPPPDNAQSPENDQPRASH